MGSKIKLSFATIIFISVTIFFGCKKEAVLTPNASTPLIDVELDNFVQNYFESKFQLLIESQSSKAALSSKRISSFYSSETVAEKCLNEINDQKKIRATADLVYTGVAVKADVDYNSWGHRGYLNTFLVKVFYSYTTNGKDLQTGEPITPAGYELYTFTVSKKGNSWLIENEEQTEDPNYNPGIISMEPDMEPSFDKNMASYSYSGYTAASFAIAHWNVVSNISSYCDYTNYGGDCTNFTSRCLRQGGWKQTNNWFYISNGASGNNMVTYKRSPSWTGANQFYQFISNTGQYAGVNGNNRVTPKFTNITVPLASATTAQWTTFYNTIKVLQKGDIVELGNGLSPAIIGHNMIVSKIQTTSPYIFVSYRNATGYLPAGDRPLYEFYGRHICGFFVKTSGN